jgi:hypothetical protein
MSFRVCSASGSIPFSRIHRLFDRPFALTSDGESGLVIAQSEKDWLAHSPIGCPLLKFNLADQLGLNPMDGRIRLGRNDERTAFSL